MPHLEMRAGWIVGAAETLRNETRYAIRGCGRQPAFASAVILTLALGISTTTSMFSVADAELWRPLPFPNPHQLVAVYPRGPEPRAAIDPVSGADLLDWRSSAPAFSNLAAVGRTSRRTLRIGVPESVRVSEVTPNFFATLARPALAGVTAEWTQTCGRETSVITDRAWRRFFDSDPGIVGRPVPLDEDTIVICGIVAADDAIGVEPDLFVALDERSTAFLDRAEPALHEGVIGRLHSAADAGVATAQLNAVAARIAAAFPARRAGHTVYVDDLREFHRIDANRTRLYFFLSAALVVLVLSWVNVVSLLLSSAVRRTAEFAVRGALGGGRWAVTRQLLVEGALLACVGGLLGFLFAIWTTEVFAANLPADFVRGSAVVPVDLRAWTFASAMTVATIAVFGVVPFVSARRIDVAEALRSGSRIDRSSRQGRATTILLTAQIALTVILMAGAGVFLKSFAALSQVPLGFDPANAVAARASLSGPRYGTDPQVSAFAEVVLGRVRATAGVVDAAVGTSSPLGSGPLVTLARADRPKPAPGEETRAILRAASPQYFRTLRIRVVRGREFFETDVAGAPRVAVINEEAARRLFGRQDAIGHYIDLLDSPRATRWARRPGRVLIVGIVANVKEVAINEIEFPDIYLPWAQAPSPSLEFVVRSSLPLADLREPLQRAVAAADPAIPVITLATFEDRVVRVLRGDRFNAMLVATFAGLAILLAVVGIHAAITYAVAGRTREFGIRLALGAHPAQLVRTTLLQSGRIGLAGAVLGMLATLVIARVIGNAWYLVPGSHNGLLFEVSTTDPVTLGASFVGIIAVALAAAAIPARRVGAVDPVRALRSE
jgi:putative ABC transport system permease protein